MTDLQAYVGIETDAVDELPEVDLLREDCRQPHADAHPPGARPHRRRPPGGVAHGDGEGDLSESSLHVSMVEASARRLAQAFVAPDQPGGTVRRYHAIDGGRLDAAVLDGEGEVVAVLETERMNNDRAEAIPSDFDTIGLRPGRGVVDRQDAGGQARGAPVPPRSARWRGPGREDLQREHAAA